MLSTPVSKNKSHRDALSAPPPGVPRCLENLEFQDAEKDSLQNLEAKTLGWCFRIRQASVGRMPGLVGCWMLGLGACHTQGVSD